MRQPGAVSFSFRLYSRKIERFGKILIFFFFFFLGTNFFLNDMILQYFTGCAQ